MCKKFSLNNRFTLNEAVFVEPDELRQLGSSPFSIWHKFERDIIRYYWICIKLLITIIIQNILICRSGST